MKTPDIMPFMFTPIRIWSDFAWKFGELTLASSQVISQRSRQLMLAGGNPNATDRREMTRMGTEKYAAAAESAQALTMGYLSLAPQIAILAFRQMTAGMVPFTNLMASNPFHPWLQARTAYETFARSTTAASDVVRSVEKVASNGMKPIHRRAVANARRLQRKPR